MNFDSISQITNYNFTTQNNLQISNQQVLTFIYIISN